MTQSLDLTPTCLPLIYGSLPVECDAVPPADVHAVLPDAVPDAALQPDAALPVPDAASAVAAVAEHHTAVGSATNGAGQCCGVIARYPDG